MFDPGDPFDPMGSFFMDEFIFYEENKHSKRQPQRSQNDDCHQSCPNCGNMLHFRHDAETVRCDQCGGRFRVD